jgi:molybdopterin-guanine dinucleotide biosynthesis protein B
MELERQRLVFGVVGSSGAGKTTLLERVIGRLDARGLAVGVVKHASHGFTADRPGKDSFRLYGAGAGAVALVSRDEMAVFRRTSCTPADPEPKLEAALEALPTDLDAVLVEGFAWTPIPRFVVVKGSDALRAEHLHCGPLLGVVRTREPAEGEAFVVPDDAVESVAEHVIRACRGRTGPARTTHGVHVGSPGSTGALRGAEGTFDHRARGG